jgi:hypothetical protein
MKRYDVVCASCCGTFHETTTKFDPERMATGDMLTLKGPFKESRWETFPEYDSTDYPDMVCPSCGMMYCGDDGRVMRLKEAGEFEEVLGTDADTTDTDEDILPATIHSDIHPAPSDDDTDDTIPNPTTPDETKDDLPEFDEDGRAQCPHCDERPNKQWWTRHLAKHTTSE